MPANWSCKKSRRSFRIPKGGVGVFTAFLNLGLVLVLLVSLEVYSSFYVQLIAGYYVPILAIQPRSKSE